MEHIRAPLVSRFFIFLICQGFVMPSFQNYEYYYAVDHLGISPENILLTQIFLASGIIFVPMIYHKFLRDAELKYNFYFSQVVYIISISIYLAMALKLNEGIIPNLALYIICGPIA